MLISPDDLDRYSQLLPDAAERLLAAEEREQAHRHEIENRLTSLEGRCTPQFYERQKRTQLVSFALSLAYLAVMVLAMLIAPAYIGVAGAAFGAALWALTR
jgi:uncharacterized membrane protein